MSSKKKAADAKSDGKVALVPRLRFPEFRGAEGWTEERLGRFLTESRLAGSKGDVAKKITVKLWGNGVFEKHEATQGSVNTQYYRRKAGQFIYSKLDFLNQAFGIVPKHLDGFESTVDLPSFDISRGMNPVFLLEYVKRKAFYERVGEAADGSRKAKRIQVDTFLECMVALPSPAEQQKIAECLSSADELIAAQARKVDALKTHKKGLMQQLFPREGESQPRLRFPEFQNDGYWQEKLLGEIAENLDNRRVPITSSSRKAGEVPYYGASGVVDYVEGFLFDEDLLCVSEDGANLVARTNPIAFSISGKTWVNNHAHVLRFEHVCSQKFVEVYLNSIKLDDYLTGMAQPKLNKAMLDRIPISHPRVAEQQRIASCLSSLDALITAETKKLETLKRHKRGLMQQLFPSPMNADV
ncbi:restriction endonuclease subunit S [Gemmatimonas aurantiaca]|uniref:restriction endonuclease subunit S n=1 Tax=Gemmatimonas aurantiaca TaxID=173480 RepID=UPI00301B887E